MISTRRLPRGSGADTAAVHCQYKFAKRQNLHVFLPLLYGVHRKKRKKFINYPVPSREVTNQTPLDGNNLIIPVQGEFGYSDFPAEDGKIYTFFYSVTSDIY